VLQSIRDLRICTGRHTQ